MKIIVNKDNIINVNINIINNQIYNILRKLRKMFVYYYFFKYNFWVSMILFLPLKLSTNSLTLGLHRDIRIFIIKYYFSLRRGMIKSSLQVHEIYGTKGLIVMRRWKMEINYIEMGKRYTRSLV